MVVLTMNNSTTQIIQLKIWYRIRQRILHIGLWNDREALKEMYNILIQQEKANPNKSEVPT